jgi:putative endonuclease
MADYWIYILHCKNDTYYTGYTTNIHDRYQAHLNGSSKCKYTRSFKPIRIAQCWLIDGDKSLAMKIERFIKKLSRAEKIKLILNSNDLAQTFPTKPIDLIKLSNVSSTKT